MCTYITLIYTLSAGGKSTWPWNLHNDKHHLTPWSYECQPSAHAPKELKSTHALHTRCQPDISKGTHSGNTLKQFTAGRDQQFTYIAVPLVLDICQVRGHLFFG